MKAITIRGVEPEVADKLKSSAAEQGKSINQLTLEIVKEGLGLKKGKKYSREYDDLDRVHSRFLTEREFKKPYAPFSIESVLNDSKNTGILKSQTTLFHFSTCCQKMRMLP